MRLFAIPVRRSPTQKPIYLLVFGTRKSLGLWHFADDTARATDKWWDALAAQEKAKYDAMGRTRCLVTRQSDQEGYAKPRLLLASESLSGIVQKAGDTPHQVIGNGFSER